jgi:O-antigen ligase/polysaccharide polymerase Wzy-like membrane protein
MPTSTETGAGLRRPVLLVACTVLLAGPTALAFFSGGYFTEPRVWAGLAAWVLVVVAVAVSPRPVPRDRAGRLAIGGLLALALWTLASTAWAPIAGSAYDAGQLGLVYAGGLIAAAALLRPAALQRAVEPGLAAGAVIVVGYGLAGRLVPGILHYARSISAQGRLEQPLTYWNAMGELAALGFVLCARLAGDAARPRALRAIAAAACAPLGMGLYLSVSRGALFACAAGLVALVVLMPARAQLRALGVAVAAGALASVVSAPFGGVTSLAGSLGTRERDGAIVLVALAVITVATAATAWLLSGREDGGAMRLPRRAPQIALAVICAGFALAVVVGSKESSAQPLSAGATRYESLQSNRYAYWRVALKAFAAEPVHGVGAGGWAVWWLRDRTVNEGAQDAHSLELQTLAELGLVGAALLLVTIGGVAVAARRAHRVAPALSAGPTAAAVAYLAHSPLDWDWQMPAVTLIAIVLSGLLIAVADADQPSPWAGAGRPQAPW